jgi:hypothetical protein
MSERLSYTYESSDIKFQRLLDKQAPVIKETHKKLKQLDSIENTYHKELVEKALKHTTESVSYFARECDRLGISFPPILQNIIVPRDQLSLKTKEMLEKAEKIGLKLSVGAVVVRPLTIEEKQSLSDLCVIVLKHVKKLHLKDANLDYWKKTYNGKKSITNVLDGKKHISTPGSEVKE